MSDKSKDKLHSFEEKVTSKSLGELSSFGVNELNKEIAQDKSYKDWEAEVERLSSALRDGMTQADPNSDLSFDKKRRAKLLQKLSGKPVKRSLPSFNFSLPPFLKLLKKIQLTKFAHEFSGALVGAVTLIILVIIFRELLFKNNPIVLSEIQSDQIGNIELRSSGSAQTDDPSPDMDYAETASGYYEQDSLANHSEIGGRAFPHQASKPESNRYQETERGFEGNVSRLEETRVMLGEKDASKIATNTAINNQIVEVNSSPARPSPKPSTSPVAATTETIAMTELYNDRGRRKNSDLFQEEAPSGITAAEIIDDSVDSAGLKSRYSKANDFDSEGLNVSSGYETDAGFGSTLSGGGFGGGGFVPGVGSEDQSDNGIEGQIRRFGRPGSLSNDSQLKLSPRQRQSGLNSYSATRNSNRGGLPEPAPEPPVLADVPVTGYLFGKNGTVPAMDGPDASLQNQIGLNRSSQKGLPEIEGRINGVANGALMKAEPKYQSLNKEVPIQTKEKKLLKLKQSHLSEVEKVTQRIVPKTESEPFPEIDTIENAFSSFSLNVNDVSFQLAQAAFSQGKAPDRSQIRSEEFINAFDYKDPRPELEAAISMHYERARHPFETNREVLRVGIQTASQGWDQKQRMNLVVLQDTSGSMQRPDRIEITHGILGVISNVLTQKDRITFIGFSRLPKVWIDNSPGGNQKKFLSVVDGIQPDGGTNIDLALKQAYQKAKENFIEGGVNRILLLTDGAANLGNVDPTGLKVQVDKGRLAGISLDCLGIGWDGFDDLILEEITRNSNGTYGFLGDAKSAREYFKKRWLGAVQVAAKDVKIQVEFNPQRVSRYRQVGYMKHRLTKQQFYDNSVDAGEIPKAEDAQAVYIVETKSDGQGPIGWLRVRYKDPQTEQVHMKLKVIGFSGSAPSMDNANFPIKLAFSSGVFAERISGNPYGTSVDLAYIQKVIESVISNYPNDKRPVQLLEMIRVARSLKL